MAHLPPALSSAGSPHSHFTGSSGALFSLRQHHLSGERLTCLFVQRNNSTNRCERRDAARLDPDCFSPEMADLSRKRSNVKCRHSGRKRDGRGRRTVEQSRTCSIGKREVFGYVEQLAVNEIRALR